VNSKSPFTKFFKSPGQDSCKSKVNCGSQTVSLKVTCSGTNSCAQDIIANEPSKIPVTIQCTGTNSCQGPITATGMTSVLCTNNSCSKKIVCGSGGSTCNISCGDAGSCPAGACCRTGTTTCSIDPPDAAVGGACP